MEGWRPRRLGSKAKSLIGREKSKTTLTLTGLLMEGVWYISHHRTEVNLFASSPRAPPGDFGRHFASSRLKGKGVRIKWSDTPVASSRIMVDAVGKVRPIFDGSVPRFASSPSAWPGFVMEEYEVPAGEFPRRVVFRDHIFGTFEGENPVTQYWRDGKFERHHKIRRGDVTLRSNQELIGCRWDYAARIVVLAVPHATLADIFAEIIPNQLIEFRAHPTTRDDILRHLLLALYHDMRKGSPSGSLFAEATVEAIATHALRSHGTLVPRFRRYHRGLPPGRLRSIVEYIHANLDQCLHVGQLAQMAGISSYHFGQLFKQSTGTTAHQYVLRARVRRAKELLLRTDLSLGDVGASVGLPNQSHFTELFRRRVGATPKEYRSQSR